MPRPTSYAAYCMKENCGKGMAAACVAGCREYADCSRRSRTPRSWSSTHPLSSSPTSLSSYALSLHDALPILTSSVNSRERSGINTILHELNPLFTINVTMRDIKSKNVYSRVNSKATTQWRKTESANGVHLEGVASDNRSS